MKTLRAGLYARVSTAEQHTLPMQMAALREYAERRDWIVAHAIEEVGNGAKKRPRQQELLTLAKQRRLDVIIVWRLDRWGRSLVDLMESLSDLTALGVGFVSITEALDLTTPTGRAMTGMLAVFAQFERELLVERVRAGMAQAKKTGKAIGRPATAREKTENIRDRFAKGFNKQQIAECLHIGRASVFRALTGFDETTKAQSDQTRP